MSRRGTGSSRWTRSRPRRARQISAGCTERPERIVLFAKFPSCLAGHGDPIVRPAFTSELDYEGELAVIIGRRAANVAAADALDFVGGYSIINDVSGRDLQGAEPQINTVASAR